MNDDVLKRFECPECERWWACQEEDHLSPFGRDCPGVPVERTYVAVDALSDKIRDCPECSRLREDVERQTKLTVQWATEAERLRLERDAMRESLLPLCEAAMQLWDGYAEHWGDVSDMFDSSLALPGLSLKGSVLHSIGLALGVDMDPEGNEEDE